MSRNYKGKEIEKEIEIEWTLTEIRALQKADEMVYRGGYHFADILNFLNKNLRADKQRRINIPKEVGYHEQSNCDAEH